MIGTDASMAQASIEKRGFSKIETRAFPRNRINVETQSLEQEPPTFEQVVKQNLGFVDIEGNPSGKLACFAHGYSRFIASGERLICFTSNNAGQITWRQAGWRGVVL
ncbi:hypothetical protein [Ruegeria hyattellae]|uniref:hypothetical protein n=1 Tax=Ruegeria hyattellae TaxID=3233337 RepID=UPI00355BAFC3